MFRPSCSPCQEIFKLCPHGSSAWTAAGVWEGGRLLLSFQRPWGREEKNRG